MTANSFKLTPAECALHRIVMQDLARANAVAQAQLQTILASHSVSPGTMGGFRADSSGDLYFVPATNGKTAGDELEFPDVQQEDGIVMPNSG